MLELRRAFIVSKGLIKAVAIVYYKTTPEESCRVHLRGQRSATFLYLNKILHRDVGVEIRVLTFLR